MGWASGSELAEDVWNVVRPLIPGNKRKNAAASIVELFEYCDCDTLYEAEQLVADSGLPGYAREDVE
jgi:hypothetical protein